MVFYKAGKEKQVVKKAVLLYNLEKLNNEINIKRGKFLQCDEIVK